MAVLERQITADNFLEAASLPEYVDCLVELVEGEIVTMPVTNAMHSAIVGRLAAILGYFIVQHDLGRFHSGDAGLVVERSHIGRDTVRGIDLVFISWARATEALGEHLLETAPDLAVEVMSPSNTVADLRLKVRQLLDAGTQQVWVVHPNTREVDVHTRRSTITFGEGDTLTGGDILPGFKLDVADIFPR